MKIMVTGGAGFIGFHVAKAFADREDEVVVVDNLNDYYDVSLKKARVENLNKDIKFIKADVSNFKEMDEIFSKSNFDKVCHLAAQAGVRYSIENPFAYETANGMGHLVILELCKKYNIKSLVHASSSSVYGGNEKIPFEETDDVSSPVSLYSATKIYNELQSFAYHKLYGMNIFGLRFFTVYGPWGRPDMALFKFVKCILANQEIEIYNNGDMSRDFTYIADIVDGVISAVDNCSGCEFINLGRGQSVKLLDYVEIIESELGMKAKRKMMPMQKGDVHRTFSNIDKAKRLLGYDPKVSVEEGIREFVKWYKGYYLK